MGEREGACAEARGGNEHGVPEEWKEGFGSWNTEGEGGGCPMRQERKVRAAPEAPGRGGGAVGESGGHDM